MKMKQIMASLSIITTLLMHLTVTSIANNTTITNTNSISFNFQILANNEGPNHTTYRDKDGFLHFQHKLGSSGMNITTPRTDTFHPLQYETIVMVGTGAVEEQYFLKIDALSSLTWLQCKPCAPKARQIFPIFDPTESPTFRHVAASNPMCKHPYEPVGEKCSFHLSGPFNFSVHGFLVKDVFMKDLHIHHDFLFGCSHSTENFESEGRYAGVFGMGRMPNSLVMQIAAKGWTQFSYCLFRGSNTKHQGSLTFGTNIPHSLNYGTTRILPALRIHESEYFLSLMGISLGTRKLDNIRPEMFARHMNGQGGCVIDLGTPITVMIAEAYHIVEEAIWSDLQHHQAERVKQPGFGLCVRTTKRIMRQLQSISLHYSEEDAVLVFSPEQLFLMMNKKQEQFACLAMTPGQRTIIGAFQQVDTRFIYDLKNSKLSFARESCCQDKTPLRLFE